MHMTLSKNTIDFSSTILKINNILSKCQNLNLLGIICLKAALIRNQIFLQLSFFNDTFIIKLQCKIIPRKHTPSTTDVTVLLFEKPNGCPGLGQTKEGSKEKAAIHLTTTSELVSITCHMGSQCYLPPETVECTTTVTHSRVNLSHGVPASVIWRMYSIYTFSANWKLSMSSATYGNKDQCNSATGSIVV